jgi:autotransporter-associated beta strand protein
MISRVAFVTLRSVRMVDCFNRSIDVTKPIDPELVKSRLHPLFQTVAVLSLTGFTFSQAADQYWNPSPLSDDWANAVWSATSGGGSLTTWTASNDAIFDQAGTYTATINAAQTATNINIKAGNVTFSGTNTVSANTITIDSGATLAGAGDRFAKSGTTQVTINGTLDLTAGGFSGGRFIQLAGSGNIIGGFRHSGTASFSGNIQNVSPTVRAAILWNGGTGGTLTLSGNNSGMSGDVLMSIANSVIKLNSANAFSSSSHLRFSGNANSNLIELAAADFTPAWYTGSNAEGNGGVSWTGTNAGFYATGGDRNLTFVTTTGGTTAASLVWGSNGLTSSTVVLGAASSTHKLTWTNDINLNGATRTISTANGSADVEAEISGSLSGTGASAITKTGTGVLLLSNANTYAGGTIIAESQNALNPLRISHGSALGSGSLTIGAGGNNDRSRLELVGGITVANSVVAMTSRNNVFASILNVSGNNTMSANLSSGGGGARLTLQSDDGKLTLSGNFSAGRSLHLAGAGDGEIEGTTNVAATYGLEKTGDGTWIINNGNLNNTTATVTAGTLLVNGALANSSATVNGGTLGGTGGSITGLVTINDTGVLSPGASIGTLATGELSFTTGSTFLYELNTTTPAGDRLDANGNLSLAGTVTLDLADLGSSGLLGLNTKFTMISYSGTWDGNIFDGYADDSAFTLFGNEWRINYNDVSAGSVNGGAFTNAVTLTVIPEPGSALLGGLGLLALLRRRR